MIAQVIPIANSWIGFASICAFFVFTLVLRQIDKQQVLRVAQNVKDDLRLNTRDAVHAARDAAQQVQIVGAKADEIAQKQKEQDVNLEYIHESVNGGLASLKKELASIKVENARLTALLGEKR